MGIAIVGPRITVFPERCGPRFCRFIGVFPEQFVSGRSEHHQLFAVDKNGRDFRSGERSPFSILFKAHFRIVDDGGEQFPHRNKGNGETGDAAERHERKAQPCAVKMGNQPCRPLERRPRQPGEPAGNIRDQKSERNAGSAESAEQNHSRGRAEAHCGPAAV